MKKNKSNEHKLRFGFTPLWASRSIALGVGTMFLGQITYYSTEVVGLSAAVVGTLLMASKLFDSISELVVGFIVDKTNTKMGKGRPFEIFIIPFWISVVFLFSVPDMGATGKMIYIFILYTLAMSVFQTLLAGAETVYLGRAILDQQQRGKLMARSGVLVMTVSAIASMIMPQLISMWGSLPGGWTKIAMVYAIPMGIIGMLRFFFIKEEVVNDVNENIEPISLKESINLLVKNKYIWILGGLILLSWLVTGIVSSVGIYYFSYVIGDIGLLSVIGMTGLFGPFLLLLFPLAIRTVGSKKFVQIGLLLALFGNILKFLMPTSVPTVVLGTFISSVGTTTITMLNSYFILQCIEYGFKITGRKIEGLPTSFTNFAGQVGNGIASLLIGLVMGASGYIASSPTQSVEAISSIVSLYSIIPAVICLLMLVLVYFFNVEKELDKLG